MRMRAAWSSARSVGPARRAASEAASDSIAKRISANSIRSAVENVRSRSQRRASGSKSFQRSSGSAQVPCRGRAPSSPLAVSILMASRRTVRLTPYCRHSWASIGKGFAIENRPVTIATPRSWVMRRVRFCGREGTEASGFAVGCTQPSITIPRENVRPPECAGLAVPEHTLPELVRARNDGVRFQHDCPRLPERHVQVDENQNDRDRTDLKGSRGRIIDIPQLYLDARGTVREEHRSRHRERQTEQEYEAYSVHERKSRPNQLQDERQHGGSDGSEQRCGGGRAAPEHAEQEDHDDPGREKSGELLHVLEGLIKAPEERSGREHRQYECRGSGQAPDQHLARRTRLRPRQRIEIDRKDGCDGIDFRSKRGHDRSDQRCEYQT